jgi:hypothetical protein
MRLAIMGHIEYRVFSLLLSALRIAAANVKHLSLTPKPTHMVIDPESVENRPLGATAWSEAEGKDYDMIDIPDIPQKPASHRAPKPEKEPPKMIAKHKDDACLDSYERLVAGVARDPDSLDKIYAENEANSAPEKWGTILWNPVSEGGKRAQEPTLTP